MIDIHCHPLAGIDDGAETFEVSMAMCKAAAADGITHVVATPHCNFRYEFRAELSRQKILELQAALGDSPKLLLGCDFNLSYDNIQRLTEVPGEFTINGTNYLLVELASAFIPQQYDSVFFDLQVAGFTPILTHPERNPVLCRKPELLFKWVTRGCLVQVTAQSYTGAFGRRAQELAELWLARNLIHFFATDAHDLTERPPVLSPCYRKVAEARGDEIADLLHRKNPEAVIQGLPLPLGPQPLGPDEGKPRKRGWLSFLRG